MEFITTEVAEKLGLTPEQITGLTPEYENHLATLKKDWDGVANTNAENILTGAAKYVQTKLGVTEERQQGEKYGDYLARLADKSLEAKQTEVDKLKSDYAQKLKDFNGDNATKAELDKAKAELDDAKKLLADFDTIKGKAEKFDEANEKLSGLKVEVALSAVKPNFPETANPFEVDARWSAFKKNVLEKYTIELVDDVPMAIDKENKYKQVKLFDLVAADKDIEALSKGREQRGTGAQGVGKEIKIEGLDFAVPETAKKDTTERAKLIRGQLEKDGVLPTSKEYSAKFAEYNKKIMDSK